MSTPPAIAAVLASACTLAACATTQPRDAPVAAPVQPGADAVGGDVGSDDLQTVAATIAAGARRLVSRSRQAQ